MTERNIRSRFGQLGEGRPCLSWIMLAALRIPLQGLCSAEACAFPICSPQGPLQKWEDVSHGETPWRIFCVLPPLGKQVFQMAGAHRKSRLLPAYIFIFAERQGFEPREAIHLNSFQDCRNRPLCHLSELGCKDRPFSNICKKSFSATCYTLSFCSFLPKSFQWKRIR